jgi:hypothetical protein
MALQPHQELLVRLVALRNRLQRVVGELVVVAIVAERRGALRKVLEITLILLFEQRILRSEANGNRLRVLRRQQADKGKKA